MTMAIRSGVCVGAKASFLAGVFRDMHRYRMALYGADAVLGPDTDTYTRKGEVIAPGYDRGGRDIPGWHVRTKGDAAYIGFEDVVWPEATIRARGALVYNDSVPGMPAVAVLNFGGDIVSTNGPFTVGLRDFLLTIS